jgi:multimeric flavodoxin WrbA
LAPTFAEGAMPKLVVVYHSGFGHTQVVARAVADGASSVSGVEAEVIPVRDFPTPTRGRYEGAWAKLEAADAIVLGCPTYMGSLSAAMKEFMEKSSGLWFRQAWKDKIAAGFTNSGALSGDKLNTLIDLALFCAQHSMIWVTQGLMYEGPPSGRPNQNRLASWIGAMSQSSDGPPETTVNLADLASARQFGIRVAQATVRWTRGLGGAAPGGPAAP